MNLEPIPLSVWVDGWTILQQLPQEPDMMKTKPLTLLLGSMRLNIGAFFNMSGTMMNLQDMKQRPSVAVA